MANAAPACSSVTSAGAATIAELAVLIHADSARPSTIHGCPARYQRDSPIT
jgi:hypothetical protein